jgi:hypothetical protein
MRKMALAVLRTNINSKEVVMLSELAQLERDHLIFLAAGMTIVVASVSSLFWILARQWRLGRQARQALAFKRELLQRGLAVEEIERLLAAGKPNLLGRFAEGAIHSVERLVVAGRRLIVGGLVALQWSGIRRAQLELRFKTAMIERGLSVAEIERLIHTRQPSLWVRLGEALEAAGASLAWLGKKVVQSVRSWRRSTACAS